MRDEAAQIAGDWRSVLADSHAAAFLVDHPKAENGIAVGARVKRVGEDGWRCEALVNLEAIDVRTIGLDDVAVWLGDYDVCSFAGVHRFTHPSGGGLPTAGA